MVKLCVKERGEGEKGEGEKQITSVEKHQHDNSMSLLVYSNSVLYYCWTVKWHHKMVAMCR